MSEYELMVMQDGKDEWTRLRSVRGPVPRVGDSFQVASERLGTDGMY